MKTCTCGQKQRKNEGEGCEKQSPHTFPQKKKKSAPYDACISDEFFVVGRFFLLLSLEAGKFAATNNTECHFFSLHNILHPYRTNNNTLTFLYAAP